MHTQIKHTRTHVHILLPSQAFIDAMLLANFCDCFKYIIQYNVFHTFTRQNGNLHFKANNWKNCVLLEINRLRLKIHVSFQPIYLSLFYAIFHL